MREPLLAQLASGRATIPHGGGEASGTQYTLRPMNSFANRKTPQQPSGVPNVAALLTWFLPGAGHFYLGRATFGIVAFIVVEGIYLLGLKLSGGMGFEFLQEELRGAFAPALAPEIGNLGALVYHIQSYGFGPGFPRVFPDHIVLGTTLTAVSGILNVCLICHAHFEARLPKTISSGKRSPALPVLLTWLVPGLGHIFQGRKLRGALVFFCLAGCVVFGTLLADSSNLSRERHYYYWGGQFMAGLPALVLQAMWGAKRVLSHIQYGEAGMVFASVAGMLNILAMLDVYRFAEDKWEAEQNPVADAPQTSDSEAPQEATA